MKLALRLLPILALLLAWLGYFSPWVAPKPVGLQLTAHDLVEWMSFAQTVRDGTFPVSRLELSLPLAGLALLAALTPALILSTPAKFPYWLSLPFLALALFSALLIQPPYPYILTAYSDPELQPQFWLGIATLILSIPLALFAALRPRWATWLIALLSIFTLLSAWHAYTIVQPPLIDIITKPIPVGYGFILCLIGLLGLLVLATVSLITQFRSPSKG